jgi:hypothetical protein
MIKLLNRKNNKDISVDWEQFGNKTHPRGENVGKIHK